MACTVEVGDAKWRISAHRAYGDRPTRQPPGSDSRPHPLTLPRPAHKVFPRAGKTAPAAFLIGLAAGFLGVGGGFMIVPGLMLVSGLELSLAVAASLLSIAAFAGVVGIKYWAAASVRLSWSFAMLVSGFAGGASGVWLGQRFSKVIMLRVFSTFLVALGVYMLFR